MKKLVLALFLISSPALIMDEAAAASYHVRNTELGIVYRPPSLEWDSQQWDSIFSDLAPPMGWAFLPIGKESCDAIPSSWLNRAKRKEFRLGILLVPSLNVSDIKKTVDCASSSGFRRAVLAEYISYQTQNLNKPLCTVLSEVRSVYDYTKRRHPSFQFDIAEKWQTWIALLSRGQVNSCSGYPHFRFDQAGVSILSKYGNPTQRVCGHPTAQEIQEQLTDLKPTLRDHSRSGKIFAWQLNQNWYPGREDILQLFRQLKPIYGFEPFLLYGPTSTDDGQDNWGYRTHGSGEDCSQNRFEWYLPARDYLVRIREGLKTFIDFDGPNSIRRGSTARLHGNIRTTKGIQVNNIELQLVPPVGSRQIFAQKLEAPFGARLAFVGVRVNDQVPLNIKGSADLLLDLVELFREGSTKNLIENPNFKDRLSKWSNFSTGSVSVVSDGADKNLRIRSSSSQKVSVTSVGVLVSPGDSYTVRFHANLFSESRNNAYFFVSWNSASELRRDHLFLRFPDRRTIATTSARRDGTFSFSFRPTEPGLHTLSAFFKGTRAYQPSIHSFKLAVN